MSVNRSLDTSPPRRITVHVDAILEMPLELFRETIFEYFAPGAHGAKEASKILHLLAGVLMSGTTPAGARQVVHSLDHVQATRKAVGFLEMADVLDGLDPSRTRDI